MKMSRKWAKAGIWACDISCTWYLALHYGASTRKDSTQGPRDRTLVQLRNLSWLEGSYLSRHLLGKKLLEAAWLLLKTSLPQQLFQPSKTEKKTVEISPVFECMSQCETNLFS